MSVLDTLFEVSHNGDTPRDACATHSEFAKTVSGLSFHVLAKIYNQSDATVKKEMDHAVLVQQRRAHSQVQKQLLAGAEISVEQRPYIKYSMLKADDILALAGKTGILTQAAMQGVPSSYHYEPGTTNLVLYYIFPRIKDSTYPVLRVSTSTEAKTTEDLLDGNQMVYPLQASHAVQAYNDYKICGDAFDINCPVTVDLTTVIEKLQPRAEGLQSVRKSSTVTAALKRGSMLPPPSPGKSNRPPSLARSVSHRSLPAPALPASNMSCVSTTAGDDVDALSSVSVSARGANIESSPRGSASQPGPEPGSPPPIPRGLEDDLGSDVSDTEGSVIMRHRRRTDLWLAATVGRQGNDRYQCTRAVKHARAKGKSRTATKIEEWRNMSEECENLSEGEIMTKSDAQIESAIDIMMDQFGRLNDAINSRLLSRKSKLLKGSWPSLCQTLLCTTIPWSISKEVKFTMYDPKNPTCSALGPAHVRIAWFMEFWWQNWVRDILYNPGQQAVLKHICVQYLQIITNLNMSTEFVTEGLDAEFLEEHASSFSLYRFASGGGVVDCCLWRCHLSN